MAIGPRGATLQGNASALLWFRLGATGKDISRIAWLRVPRDPQGLLDRDKNNPDPALRQRKRCGLNSVWGFPLRGRELSLA
jgi:hypothetical protein